MTKEENKVIIGELATNGASPPANAIPLPSAKPNSAGSNNATSTTKPK